MTDTDDRLTLTMSEIMPPNAANFSGKVHGGYILSLLDTVAYACAARYSKNYAVTLSVDQVFFRKPVYVGELVTFFASVNFVGNTSMEIGIKVVAENLENGEIRHTNTCYFTMVAIGKDGKTIKIPPLKLETKDQIRRFKEGEHRRKIRLESAEEHKRYKEKIKQELEKD